jgi:hypothetical protein
MRTLLFVALAIACGNEDEPRPPPAEPPPVIPVPPAPPPEPPAFDDRPTGAEGHGRRVRVVFRGAPIATRREGPVPRWACPIGASLYVIDATGRVWVADPSTGERRELDEPTEVRAPDCGTDGVYFERGGALHRVGPDGAVSLGEVADDPLNTVMTADALYFGFFDRKEIFRLPRAGGEVARVARGTSDPGPLAVDATHVYWTEYRSGNVSRAPLGGGAVQVIARRQPHPIGVAVDAEHVYWGNETDGTIFRASKEGGDAVELVRGQTNHDEIGTRQGYVYWRSWGRGPEGHTFARVASAGGPIEVLVSRLSMPEGFVFIGERAYLVSKGHGEVLEVEL